jgi:hypothetical protein
MKLVVVMAIITGGIFAGGVDVAKAAPDAQARPVAQAAPKHGTWRACKIVVQGGTINGWQMYYKSVGWGTCKRNR